MFLGSYVVVIVLVIFTSTVVVTYGLAVGFRHVKPFWPFISYAGNRPLESCIFSFALDTCSALFVLLAILRYVQLCDAIETSEEDETFLRRMNKSNVTSMAFGVLGAFGLSITASFQQRNFSFAHFVGVFTCTYSTLVYFIMQTYLTFKLVSQPTTRLVKAVRLVSVVGSCVILICCPVLVTYSFFNVPHRMNWLESNQHQGGIYLVGAILEWALLLFFFLFIGSFYPDLKKVRKAENDSQRETRPNVTVTLTLRGKQGLTARTTVRIFLVYIILTAKIKDDYYIPQQLQDLESGLFVSTCKPRIPVLFGTFSAPDAHATNPEVLSLRLNISSFTHIGLDIIVAWQIKSVRDLERRK